MDYLPVVQTLLFSVGDVFSCLNITIIEDNECELDMVEDFLSNIAYVAGDMPIALTLSTTRVVIEDNNEPECGMCLFIYGKSIILP